MDSPAGLAAWVGEKMRSWSDGGGTADGTAGDRDRGLTDDDVLTNVTQYWLTGTIGSSMRMYAGANAAIPPAQLARTTNLVRFTEPPRGGHFAAYEEPELYARELREFFRPSQGR